MKKGLSSTQKNLLLEQARKTISNRLNKNDGFPDIPEDPVFREKAATFVTLKISGKLRGCIGTLEPATSLWQSVHDNALSAAFSDHRFSPLSHKELEAVEIDISVLSSPSSLEYEDPVDLLKKLQPGVDGVILKDGRRGATFLPQVWKQLPSAELFLGQLCKKAGLEETAWREKHLDIKTYQVLSFQEEGK